MNDKQSERPNCFPQIEASEKFEFQAIRSIE